MIAMGVGAIEAHKRFLFPIADRRLPLYVETSGYNNIQENIVRPDGYPYYHWLQTVYGEGRISHEGRNYPLSVNSGVLLFPSVPHTYKRVTDDWETLYLTFDGSLAMDILKKLGIERSVSFQWDVNARVSGALWELIEVMDQGGDLSGLDASANIFKLLTLLKKYAHVNDRVSLSIYLERLSVLMDWLENHYRDPAISLVDMASVLDVGSRYLNVMFNAAFGVSAYHYLISFRISKAKELLSSQAELSVREVALQSGYRDVSHFIATFRRHEGTTPQRFKELYQTNHKVDGFR